MGLESKGVIRLLVLMSHSVVGGPEMGRVEQLLLLVVLGVEVLNEMEMQVQQEQQIRVTQEEILLQVVVQVSILEVEVVGQEELEEMV
tara:strand:- start:352 stop:615 length:264 start_codon:yes stop_codon:yes gene_type:complete